MNLKGGGVRNGWGLGRGFTLQLHPPGGCGGGWGESLCMGVEDEPLEDLGLKLECMRGSLRSFGLLTLIR